MPAAPVRRDQDRSAASATRSAWASQLPPELLAAVQGPRRHRLRVHEQDRLRGRRAGEARPVRQERADAAGEGVRDQHPATSTARTAARSTPTSTSTAWCRTPSSVIAGNADPLRRIAPRRTAGPKGSNFPELNQAGRVRDRLHRRRQEQPGAGPQGPAAAARRRPAPPGRSSRVVDEANKPVTDATVWLGGRSSTRPTRTAPITVPFSTSPGRRPIVLTPRRLRLPRLPRPPARRRTGSRPASTSTARACSPSGSRRSWSGRGCSLNGLPVSVKLLEEVRLRITSIDHDGIPSSAEVPDFKLFEDRESIHEFRVPPRLATLTVALTAKVKSLSTGQDGRPGRDARRSPLNGIDRTDKIEDLHLAKFGGDYVIELLGRTGEAKPDRPVQLASSTATSRSRCSVTLKTDAAGRVTLGPLADVDQRDRDRPGRHGAHLARCSTDRHTYRQLDPREGRRGGHAAVPRHGRQADPRRTRAVRGARRRDPRRQVRRARRRRRDARTARPGGRATTTCA